MKIYAFIDAVNYSEHAIRNRCDIKATSIERFRDGEKQ